MAGETVRLATVAPSVPADAPLTLFAIDNKLPNVIFLIVSGVLASASEGFDRYVLSLSIYPVSRSLIKDTSQLRSASARLRLSPFLPFGQLYPTVPFLSIFLPPSSTPSKRQSTCFCLNRHHFGLPKCLISTRRIVKLCDVLYLDSILTYFSCKVSFLVKF